MNDAPEPGEVGVDLLALGRVAYWIDGLCSDLQDAVVAVRRLVEQVGHDWSDAHGRQWVAEAELLHRDLGRQAELGTELARVIGRITEEAPGAGPDGVGMVDGLGVLPAPSTGARLGGTEGMRVEERYGVRIAMLPDPPFR